MVLKSYKTIQMRGRKWNNISKEEEEEEGRLNANLKGKVIGKIKERLKGKMKEKQ